MNKYLLGFVLTLLIISCKKDDVATPAKDYSEFLAKTGQTFQGKLDGIGFSWSFAWQQFQGTMGYQIGNGNGISDSADPYRILFFGLNSEGGGQIRFKIYSPKYNTTSEAEFSRVFGPGKKKLGDYGTDFYLSINKDNSFYQSNSFNPANEIEILKTEKYTDNIGKKLRVWFRIEAKLSTCNCQNNNSVLADGLMIAEFIGS
ncbi:MAG TPA: hypothetical protein VLR49_06295 [Ferruginibacter sp.]|nr:hypothetical protein [Ferruginibacter sp.]